MMAIRLGVFSCFLAMLPTAMAGASEPWSVVGAGNVTCAEWHASKPNQQAEAVSWMLGFASAVNVTYVSRGLSKIPLDRLTPTYLQAEIGAICAVDGNSGVDMTTVIFRVLKELPFKKGSSPISGIG
jgi:hypothetical protein